MQKMLRALDFEYNIEIHPQQKKVNKKKKEKTKKFYSRFGSSV